MVITGAKKVDINYMHFQNIRRASKRIGYGKRELTDEGKGTKSASYTTYESKSRLTSTLPCIFAVSIRLFSFIFPPVALPSLLLKRLDMWTFGQLLSALLPRRFPARPLHSETVNKWVGLQPNGNEGKQRGLFGVLMNICIDQAVLPRTHEQQTTR